MLQITTGMYFRDVLIRENIQRRTIYTNIDFGARVRVKLPTGNLTPDTDAWASVRTVSVKFVERLEQLLPDGSEDFLVSTGGHAIADDIAMVLSFALNATFTTNKRRADELIRSPSKISYEPNPADILTRTFSPNILATDDEIAAMQEFFSTLLSLNRKEYEKTMRAMRRVVIASERVAEDPTLAYTDYVAALESLSAGADLPAFPWDRFDSRKRKILDEAIQGLRSDDQDSIRSAVLEAERAGVKYRFIEFTVQHIQSSLFRDEALGVLSAIREDFIRQALATAYDARSKNLHELKELEIGAWSLVSGAHTVTPLSGRIMLTHAGLNMVARHVIRNYVQRASQEFDVSFQWRDNLPNLTQVELAPELYIGRTGAIVPGNAADRAGQFYGILIEALSGRQQLGFDMRPVLSGIQAYLATGQSRTVSEPLLSIYYLWHTLVPPEAHLESPETILSTARAELQRPGLFAFATMALLGEEPDWSIDEWCELAEARHDALQKAKATDFPSRIDSALWISVTHQFWLVGARELARASIARAIGCTPGHAELLNLEKSILANESPKFDLYGFLVGPNLNAE